MKCYEIMILNPKMCVPEDNVTVPINLMWDYDCGCVPVVKDIESKELVGMVTDRDIAMGVVRFTNECPSEKKVSECMASHVIFCQAEDPVETAIKAMSEHRLRRIPIVDGKGSCIGIISQADLLLNSTDIKPVIDALKLVSIPYSKSHKESIETVATKESPKIVAEDKTPAVISA